MFFELSIAFDMKTTLTAFIWECTTTVQILKALQELSVAFPYLHLQWSLCTAIDKIC